MSRHVLLLFFLLISLSLPAPAHAQQHGLAVPFDWIGAWGTVNPWDDPKNPETGIPTKYHAIKGTIKTVISRCGIKGTTDFSAFEVYTGNFSGTTLYILDGHKFFPEQTNCVNQVLQECIQGQGCYTGAQTLSESQVTETPPCESSGCSHTEYNSSGVWLDIVSQGVWRLVSHADFLAMREANKDEAGKYKYKDAAASGNTGNVLVAQIGRPGACTIDEMDKDNDGKEDMPCTKYYQLDREAMVDLYSPEASPEGASNGGNASLFQSNPVPSPNVRLSGYDGKTADNKGHGALVASGTDAFSRFPGNDMVGDVYDDAVEKWRGVAHDDARAQAGRASERLLPDGAARAYEIRTSATSLAICAEFKNNGDKSVFIPTRIDDEIMSFVKAVLPDADYGLGISPAANQPWATNGTVPNVSGRACERRYTKWVGPTSCSQVTPPCNSSITITAERRCQRSSGEYGLCSECSGITGANDPEGVPVGAKTPCFFQAVCSGGACPVECLDVETEGHKCVNHSSCIAAEAKALMADGSYKRLGDIKVGEEIMGFRKTSPLAALAPAKVVKIMSTPVPVASRALYQVNGIPMTAGHSVVLGSGKVVPASNVRKGDSLVGMSGEPVKVQARKKSPQANTVYSFWFDGADGFVVDGVRVLGR